MCARPGGDTVRRDAAFPAAPGVRPGITLMSMFGAHDDGRALTATSIGSRPSCTRRSAAVLMIDPRRRQVVYANPAAIELTGERVRLPVDVDAWSDAAGLTDLGGRRMSETDSPLSLVAAGVPVAGEPVAVHDAARRGSSPTPDQREASEGRLLWVTGFGLSDGTAIGPEERALVVFLQLTGTEKGERRRLSALRDRAVVATEMSFTITDPRRTDDPLIWVNPRSAGSPAIPPPKSSAATAGSCRAVAPTAPPSPAS